MLGATKGAGGSSWERCWSPLGLSRGLTLWPEQAPSATAGQQERQEQLAWLQPPQPLPVAASGKLQGVGEASAASVGGPVLLGVFADTQKPQSAEKVLGHRPHCHTKNPRSRRVALEGLPQEGQARAHGGAWEEPAALLEGGYSPSGNLGRKEQEPLAQGHPGHSQSSALTVSLRSWAALQSRGQGKSFCSQCKGSGQLSLRECSDNEEKCLACDPYQRLEAQERQRLSDQKNVLIRHPLCTGVLTRTPHQDKQDQLLISTLHLSSGHLHTSSKQDWGLQGKTTGSLGISSTLDCPSRPLCRTTREGARAGCHYMRDTDEKGQQE